MTAPYKTRWEEILELGCYQDVWKFYNSQNFPIRVRANLLPEWLEFHIDQLQLQADPNNPDDSTYFEHFMNSFIQELQKASDNILHNSTERMDLSGVSLGLEISVEVNELSERFKNHPEALFNKISTCMNWEKHLISQKSGPLKNPVMQGAEEVPVQQTSVLERYTTLNRRLVQIIGRTNENSHLSYINALRENIEQVITDLAQSRINFNSLTFEIQTMLLQHQANGVINTDLNNLQTFLSLTQTQIIEYMGKFKQGLDEFFTRLRTVIGILRAVIKEVVQLVDEWKDDQGRVANGFPAMHSLDQISSLANMLSSGILEIYKQLQCKARIENCLVDNGEPTEALVQSFRGLKADVDQLLFEFVPKTFVVEKQPPQILSLKTTIKQTVAVQLLVGNTLIPTKHLNVETILIDKEEAKKLHENSLYIPQPALTLATSTSHAIMSHDLQNNKFKAEFKGITLPQTRKAPAKAASTGTQKNRTSKETEEAVPRTKYVFYIKTSFEAPDMPSFTIWTTTLPVIVTCHPNQYADAWATILWDNAFRFTENRVPFKVKQEVNPSDLFEVISHVFKVQTRRGLTQTQKDFLKNKLMAGRTGLTTWKMFADDPINCSPTKKPVADTSSSNSKKEPPKVTFSSWLYSIKKMCEPNGKVSRNGQNANRESSPSIPSHWEGQLIEGFISRDELIEKLKASSPGTFIVYWSEAILGGITVAWFNHTEHIVQKYAPYEIQELKDNPLEERILASEFLVYLYPKIPKDVAFKTLRNSKELSDLQWKLINDGYIIHTQKQVNVNTDASQPLPPGRYRQLSSSSSSSTYASYGSPYNGPWSISSGASSRSTNSPAQMSQLGGNNNCFSEEESTSL